MNHIQTKIRTNRQVFDTVHSTAVFTEHCVMIFV